MFLGRRLFNRATQFFHLQTWIRFLMLCILVGIAAGLVGVLFERGLFHLYRLVFIDLLNRIQPGSLGSLLLLVLVPSLGLFFAGAIAFKWAPEIRGGGTDAVIRAFHREKGLIRPRVPWLKGLSTILTIGSGGSAGREGPTTQIGAGVGSFIATKFRLSDHDRRILMLAGCAGGLGAVLRAPLGGALFAAEMLYREPDFEHEAVIPGIISSVTAYSVFTGILGHEPVLNYQALVGTSNWPPVYPSAEGRMTGEFLHYALLSLLCALVAFLMVKGFRLIRDGIFGRLRLNVLAKPALGGCALGALTAVLIVLMHIAPSHVMGEGRIFLREVMKNAVSSDPGTQFSIMVLAVVLLCRILATGLTIGSGASGGLLFPTLLIGGLTGALYARFWQGMSWLPEALQMTPMTRAGMILVAMGGVFCGCNKTPIASLVLISEMSGSYGLVVPLMLCCASTYLLTTSFSMDEEQVPSLADSPAHRGDFLGNVLEDILVAEAVAGRPKPEPIPASTPYSKVLDKVKHSTVFSFPIVDQDGLLIGMFSMNDLRQILNEQSVGDLVVAGDLGTTQVPTVKMDTNLNDALSLFTQQGADELPVVEEVPAALGVEGPCRKRVLAMLTRQDLIAAYHRRLHQMHATAAEKAGAPNVFEEAQVSRAEMEEDYKSGEHGDR